METTCEELVLTETWMIARWPAVKLNAEDRYGFIGGGNQQCNDAPE